MKWHTVGYTWELTASLMKLLKPNFFTFPHGPLFAFACINYSTKTGSVDIELGVIVPPKENHCAKTFQGPFNFKSQNPGCHFSPSKKGVWPTCTSQDGPPMMSAFPVLPFSKVCPIQVSNRTHGTEIGWISVYSPFVNQANPVTMCLSMNCCCTN